MGVVCLSMYVHTYGYSVSVWEGGGEGDEVGLICLVTCLF